MNVITSNNAELFYKALEDVWVAEQTWFGSPNIAVWHCTQAIEKTMKGFLRCLNVDYDLGHELDLLLDVILTYFEIPKEMSQHILYFNAFKNKLRYRNMANDPSPEDAKLAISRTKQIMQGFNSNPKIKKFMDEARDVYMKILNANQEKYGEKIIEDSSRLQKVRVE